MLLFETHFQITLDPKRLKRFEPIPKKLEASLKEKTSFFTRHLWQPYCCRMDSARYTRAIPLAEAWSKLKLNNKNTTMINSDKYCAKYCYTIRFNIYFFIFLLKECSIFSFCLINCVKSYFTIRFNIFILFYWKSAAYFPFVFRWCKTFSTLYSYLKLEREKKSN